jgi:hypothetical protein
MTWSESEAKRIQIEEHLLEEVTAAQKAYVESKAHHRKMAVNKLKTAVDRLLDYVMRDILPDEFKNNS